MRIFGEFLTNAQGEDVVAGVRTPMHISEMEEENSRKHYVRVQECMQHSLRNTTETCRISWLL